MAVHATIGIVVHELANPLYLCFLAVLAASLTVLILLLKLRGPEDSFVVACIRVIAITYARAFHRVRIPGPREDPVPPKGAYIIVANHRSGVDPILLSVLTRRRIRFLMAREYYEIPVLKWLCRTLGCIPVNRNGNDLSATKEALRALRDGQVIGVFPQGGIREASSSLEGKSGTALLSLRTGAPIVPFYIEGTPNMDSVLRAFLTRSKATVKWAAPLKIEMPGSQKASRADLEEMTSTILARIRALGTEDKPNPVPRMST